MDDAPTSVRPYEDPLNKDQKPISICTYKPHVIYQWTEPPAFRHDNYAHFISEDCEPTNPIAKFVVATERLDLQDRWGCHPKKGQVFFTSHVRHKTYVVVKKIRHVDNVDWTNVTQGLRNLPTALEKDSQTTCRIANSGDLLVSLPQNKITEIVAEIFRGGNITITLCHGKIEVPPVEIRPKIISKYHGSLIGGHKGITKTYRRIRERYTSSVRKVSSRPLHLHIGVILHHRAGGILRSNLHLIE